MFVSPTNYRAIKYRIGWYVKTCICEQLTHPCVINNFFKIIFLLLGDNFFIGADGFTRCRACQMDCMSLGVFSSCKWAYYRYGCYKDVYCLSNETAIYLDRFAAIGLFFSRAIFFLQFLQTLCLRVAYCLIWSKCTFAKNSINWVANQLTKGAPRPDIWTRANPDNTLKFASQAAQQYARGTPYSTAYGYGLLRVRAELVKNHMIQQQVRNYMRFKVVQDVKAIFQKYYYSNQTMFSLVYKEYWNNYVAMPFWFAQQAMLPYPLSNDEATKIFTYV